MKVLILSSSEDPHAQVVSHYLRTMGADIDYLEFDKFIEQCSISCSIGMTERFSKIERGAVVLDLRSYESIWHRRPGVMDSVNRFIEPWIHKMVIQEAVAALDGMLRSIPCTWMNFPPNDRLCGQKLWQLQLAQLAGLLIPETLVTNKPELVKSFFEQCNGEVIYKLIGETTGHAIPRNERPCGIPTMRLRKEDLPYIDQVVYAPHMFQRCIKKGFDLRATVVGKEIYCTRIDSQSGRGKIDWRDDYSVPMEPFELPADICSKCLELMRMLGLNYGAIDLILSDDGKIVFIEINAAGQYLWAENRTNQPISLAIAKLLSGESEPLVKSGLQAFDLHGDAIK